MLVGRELSAESGSSASMVSLCVFYWVSDDHFDFTFCADVTAIIFVVACSSFNMVIREDDRTVSVGGREGDNCILD